MQSLRMKQFRVAELYAGTGRSVEPFRKWDRAKVSLLVDNSQFAADTYVSNFPDAPYFVKNLYGASAESLVELAGGQIDILLGCPPCQGFSDNGKRNQRDYRNRHLANFARLATEILPDAIGMENVPLAAGTESFGRFVRRLEDAGYRWSAGIVNAALFGSCQSRQRLIYIAIRDKVGTIPELPQPTHGGRRKYFNYNTRCLSTLKQAENALLGVTPGAFQVRGLEVTPYEVEAVGKIAIPALGDVLSGLPEVGSKKAETLNHRPWSHTANQRRRMAQVAEGGQPRLSVHYYSQSYGRLHRRGLAKTITTAFPNAGSGRFWHPTENRSLTLREAARIQGFPDSFRFQEPLSEAAFLVGNALDAALAKLVYRVIRRCLS